MRFLIFPFFFVFLCFAKNKQGIVNYGYIKSLHIGNKQGDEFNAQLLFDNSQSYFVSEKDSLEYNIDNNADIQAIDDDKKDRTIGGHSNLTTFSGNQVYYNNTKDSIWSFLRNPNNMYIAEKRPTINWKFEKETKKIGSYTCNKASSTFRGRYYTVWYTTEIPIPYGPWKLNGLPGLVLEAYDSEYKIYFYFKNIEYPLKKEIKIDFIRESPESSFIKWYTYEEYIKIAKKTIEVKHERVLLVAKELGTFKPIKPKFTEHSIETE